MKKFILFLFLSLTGCSLTQTTQPYDLNYLNPINTQMYRQNNVKFMFFTEFQKVLIIAPSSSASGIYRLIDPTTHHNNSSVSFKLIGTGNYNNSYMSINISKDDKPKVMLSIQGSRDQSINSLRSGVTLTQELVRSPSLSIFTTLNPWVKTSRSGIFDPNESETWSFEDYPLGSEEGLNTGKYVCQKSGVVGARTFNMIFRTNISPTQSIYTYQSFGTLMLLGLSVDLSQNRIRANFTRKVVRDPVSLATEISVFANEIKDNHTWVFNTQNDLQTPNGSLNSIDKEKWVRIDASLAFSPQDTEVWNIAASEEVITVFNSRVGSFKTDIYIMERTPAFGIFRLFSENINDRGPYHEKYFGYLKINNSTILFNIKDTQAEVEYSISNKEGTQFVAEAIAKERGFYINKASIETVAANFNANASGFKGRSGLSTVVSGDKIYIMGGY
ncbi:MAG: hypothetical protein ACRCTJ_05180, partial [Brevinema sp.]